MTRLKTILCKLFGHQFQPEYARKAMVCDRCGLIGMGDDDLYDE